MIKDIGDQKSRLMHVEPEADVEGSSYSGVQIQKEVISDLKVENQFLSKEIWKSI